MAQRPCSLDVVLLGDIQEEVEVTVLDECGFALVFLHVGFEVCLSDFLAAAGGEIGVFEDAEAVVR